MVFVQYFLKGDAKAANDMGIKTSALDFAAAAVMFPYMQVKMAAYRAALKLPGVGGVVDRHLTAKIRRLLKRYGHAEFTTDASAYKPAVPANA